MLIRRIPAIGIFAVCPAYRCLFIYASQYSELE